MSIVVLACLEAAGGPPAGQPPGRRRYGFVSRTRPAMRKD
jgi:hypothetical protein